MVERQSVRKSITKNRRLVSLASNPRFRTLSLNALTIMATLQK